MTTPGRSPALTKLSAANSPGRSVSWHDVARICRRACILREQERAADAERVLNDELPVLVAALRTTADSDASLSARVDAILAAETDRVANAAVLADFLAPLLAGRAATPAVPPSRPMMPPRAAGPPGGIAGFIDEMIAQERAPPAERRAS